MNKTWTYIKAHKIITGIIVAVVLIVGYYGYKKFVVGAAPTQYVLAQVSRGILITSVEGTGQVSAENQLDITPQGSGQITSIKVKQGDNVAAGQTLAVIDERSALVSLNQAKASVESAQANYNKVVNGATAQNVNVGEVSVQTAQTNLATSIQSAYTTTYNLIRTDMDKFFSGPTSFSPQFQISFYDSTSNSTVVLKPNDQNQTLALNAERADISTTLNQWNSDISATSTFDVDSQAEHSLQYLNKVKSFVTDISNAVNSIYLNQTKYQSNLDTYKTDAANAVATVNGLITDIQNGQQSVKSAEASLAVTTAPARPEDLATAKSQLDNANASLQAAENTYNNNIVKAPFAGQVAALNSKVGDVVGGSTIVATLTTPQKLAEISLNEVDVAKIAIGDKATLTFDALPDLTVSGTVAEINTIGAVSQGVVDYTVKIGLDTQDERVLPGMSVSASIITSSKDNVLIVPSSAVKTNTAGSYVQEIPGQTAPGTVATKVTPLNVAVQVGDSNDTETEITSGLNEGDLIVTRTISNSTTASTASANRSIFSGGGGGGAGAASRVPR